MVTLRKSVFEAESSSVQAKVVCFSIAILIARVRGRKMGDGGRKGCFARYWWRATSLWHLNEVCFECLRTREQQ